MKGIHTKNILSVIIIGASIATAIPACGAREKSINILPSNRAVRTVFQNTAQPRSGLGEAIYAQTAKMKIEPGNAEKIVITAPAYYLGTPKQMAAAERAAQQQRGVKPPKDDTSPKLLIDPNLMSNVLKPNTTHIIRGRARLNDGKMHPFVVIATTPARAVKKNGSNGQPRTITFKALKVFPATRGRLNRQDGGLTRQELDSLNSAFKSERGVAVQAMSISPVIRQQK